MLIAIPGANFDQNPDPAGRHAVNRRAPGVLLAKYAAGKLSAGARILHVDRRAPVAQLISYLCALGALRSD